MAAKTEVLPESVAIPTETIIDVAAHLFALEERLLDLHDRQESPVTETVNEMACELLGAVASDGAGRTDFRHPVAVEACARAEELLAVHHEQLDGAAEHRAAAEKIRTRRHGLARYVNLTLEGEGAGDG